MEGQEKSKKVAKEKRSVKRSKTVALPAEEIPVAAVAAKPSVRKSAGTTTVQPPARSSKTKEPSYDQVQLRAYFIGERRKSLGIPGSETSDWVQAELELKAELEAE
ncbi:MAG TPA: hypothetical protein VK775_14910 [Chthoniobacterales bacterium]|jgi:hypothetical protein|nr:hypothetical protein [Chthoniobacterales bacterium]